VKDQDRLCPPPPLGALAKDGQTVGESVMAGIDDGVWGLQVVVWEWLVWL
jgi:hypothetical protein